MDIATLAELLHETAEHHDAYEKAAPPHDWGLVRALPEARARGQDLRGGDRAADPLHGEVRGVVAAR
jgi:hypothetical protein